MRYLRNYASVEDFQADLENISRPAVCRVDKEEGYEMYYITDKTSSAHVSTNTNSDFNSTSALVGYAIAGSAIAGQK